MNASTGNELSSVDVSEDSCQVDTFASTLPPIWKIAVLADQARYYLAHWGSIVTIRKIFSFFISKTLFLLAMNKAGRHASPKVSIEVLELQAGDLVEVKSYHQIQQTLDEDLRHKGLTFTPEMLEYCGQRLRVFKRVNKICLEDKPRTEMRRLQNTVILENALCHGGSRECDRSCFFFWREAWLRRVIE